MQAGDVDNCRTVVGSDGLSIGRGDVIQTRRNDSGLRVANRQVWVVQTVNADDHENGAVWATERSAGNRPRSVRLPTEYVAEHMHLAYAATAHGVQGMTADESQVVSEAVGAASVYVGMTRGRALNRVHLVGADTDAAREQFIVAMDRNRADRGLARATMAARESVRGFAAYGLPRMTAEADLRR